MPDFRNAIKAQLEKNSADMPKGPMKQMMETYKPHILTRRRQLIEDCVRDLRLNNDHIHIVEQEMRIAIQVSFSKIISGKIIFLWYFFRKAWVLLNVKIPVSNVFPHSFGHFPTETNVESSFLWIWEGPISVSLLWSSHLTKSLSWITRFMPFHKQLWQVWKSQNLVEFCNFFHLFWKFALMKNGVSNTE